MHDQKGTSLIINSYAVHKHINEFAFCMLEALHWQCLFTYYINDYKYRVRISIRCWVRKRHPKPRVLWENWLRYDDTVLYVVAAFEGVTLGDDRCYILTDIFPYIFSSIHPSSGKISYYQEWWEWILAQTGQSDSVNSDTEETINIC